MYNLTKCALCGNEAELELSHTVPKMAVRTLKKTAIGNIRSTENPNKTIQDSEKLYMLCGDCEDLFSEKETWFANKIFHPYLKKEKTIFDYDENLAYFITSVNWRSLYLDILDFVENSVVGIDALECLIESEKIMNEFLREKRNDLGKIENHIFFFDDIKELSVGASNFADLKPHATFHRGIGSYTFCYEDEKTYGTLTNMMGVILVTLYHKPHIFFFCIGTLIDYFCSGMLVGSPVHFVLYLFEEQDRAFCMGIIINAGSIDFQNFSPEYFF